MSDVDDLVFEVAFALSQNSIGEVRKLVRSLPRETIDQLARVVAEHLLDQGWRREPCPRSRVTPHSAPFVRPMEREMTGIDLHAALAWTGFCIALNVVVAAIAAYMRRWGEADPEML
jgi:hypothetical protein